MAGEILYFLHKHFKAVLVLGMIASLGTMLVGANLVLRFFDLA
jgi:hypothetical protein